MPVKGTDTLSSTTFVIGSDSTSVAAKEIKATFATTKFQSSCRYPREEK